ncbi:MFS transporter [Siccirubricoccus sp. KC 17139]|uniref:MFS transporter n=1 Tax=Siccirubricoccus soli TaxID=2899147 RepID=A0ABT1DC80_9PROT|nr:MFS transporter [Siccirubricoccus soli]MCO6419547.1 MFS transporter [Siccirubricoccus soli]MCP2685682.1 MFS transporter [Siccirubricoccus soli]
MAPWRFALVFATQFIVPGVLMPFLPVVLAGHGLSATEIATVLAGASAVRLVAAPAVGRGTDGWGDARGVLLLAATGATCTVTGYALGQGFAGLLLLALLHALVGAPIMPLSDALAVSASRQFGFDYGRVRSAGSASFILAAIGAGLAVQAFGAVSVIWLAAAAYAGTALAVARLPRLAASGGGGGGLAAPFAFPAFRRVLPLSALIQGSHALVYGFGTLHWQAAGHSPAVVGLLWAEGVVAEVVLFLCSRPLVERLGPAGLAALAAGAGVLRWGLLAETTWLPALALAQLLHALTFGAMHLAAMRVLGTLPPGQAARAQTLHASLGTGLASGLLTFLAGPLYAAWGGAGFWVMAGLCAMALPLTLRLRTAMR